MTEIATAPQAKDMVLESVNALGFNQQDMDLVKALFDGTATSLEAFIPDDIEEEKLRSWLGSSSRVWMVIGKAQRQLRPIIGQMLKVVQKRPEILQSLVGEHSFSHFMNNYVPEKFGISVNEGWAALNTITDYPGISCDQYEAVGKSNLRNIARAVPNVPGQEEIDPSVLEKRMELVKIAVEMKGERGPVSTDKLAMRIQEMGIARKNEIIPDKITIFCDERLCKAWNEMCEDPRIISASGSNHQTAIFESMMATCYAMWVVEGEAMMESNEAPPWDE